MQTDLTLSLDSEQPKSIHDFWPMAGFEPRGSQIAALDWIQGLPEDTKYIMAEIPVGGGKSAIALNVSRWMSNCTYGDAYILTPQKILQAQYQNEPSFQEVIHAMYGKSNYQCNVRHILDCETSGKLKPKCENCVYREELGKMRSAGNSVLNYHLFLNLARLSLAALREDKNPMLRKRRLLVMDECHNIESTLTEMTKITFSQKKCVKLGIKFEAHNSVGEAIGWIVDVYAPALQAHISATSAQVADIVARCSNSNSSPTDAEIKLMKELDALKHHRNLLIDLIEKDEKEIIEKYALISERDSFDFKELYGKEVFKKYILPFADKFLFMSSTILDKDEFCTDLGISPSRAEMISMPSEFPLENRPIFFSPIMKMNYGWDGPARQKERQQMLEALIGILKDNAQHSGLIHTGSFNIAKWLVAELEGHISHQILHHNPGEGYRRDDVIQDFSGASGGIPQLLISPSITEGLDLKDDKSRFCIFMKVPFPNMGDAWVKRRMDISDKWYKRKALTSIIQGGGRVVRSAEDWGVVYILDASFGYLYNSGKKMIPGWWNESLTIVK